MDKIQKELIKLGRKDLAEEYYKKIAMSRKQVINKTKSDLLKEYNKTTKLIDQAYSSLDKMWLLAKNVNIKLFNENEKKNESLKGIATNLGDNVLYMISGSNSSVNSHMKSLKKQIDNLKE